MSATLGEGGELERITGVRKIERLPAPEGWDREGTGRRFVLFPERSLPFETATKTAVTLAGDTGRSLILAPNRYTAEEVTRELKELTPSPAILFAKDIENSLEPFLNKEHAALVLHNRYDGLDLPGEACHLEWICGLPGATNAQEAFLLNRLGIHALLRDRIRTRLTQALGRCTRNPTDHALVIMSGPRVLDFCIKSENRSGFHPELQAEIQYGLDASQIEWPDKFLEVARAFLRKDPGWEGVDEWIREERDSYPQIEDKVAQDLMAIVQDEIEYVEAMWVGDYQRALQRARSCADQLGGAALATYRAWWYYLAGSSAALSATRDNSEHLNTVAHELFGRACAASPRSTWFREAFRLAGIKVSESPVDDPQLLIAAETIERRLQEVGVAGARFEDEARSLLENLNCTEANPFEQGLEQLGYWLGIDAGRPKGTGVPDGIWSCSDSATLVFEAKSNENSAGPISLSTAREAQGHVRWFESQIQVSGAMPISAVIVSDRTTVARDALPSAKGLSVVSLSGIRELGQRAMRTIRALRAEASETDSESFRIAIAERLTGGELDPKSIQATFVGNLLEEFPVQD